MYYLGNAYGFWRYVQHKGSDESMVNFRKQCIYEDLVSLAETGKFTFTKQHVDDLWTNGGGAACGVDDSIDADGAGAPTPTNMPPTPDRASSKRLKINPILIGNVAHKLKTLPKSCYNVVEHIEGEGEGPSVQFKQTPLKGGSTTVHKNQYPQYHCSVPKCPSKVRTYCACEAVGAGGRVTMYCAMHFALHANQTQ